MWYGNLTGIGAITLHTGIPGDHITGISTSDTITTGITIIMPTSIIVTTIAITTGTISIIATDDRILIMSVRG
jgi:hypothetical protein